jgi:hypothetical protein
MFFIVGFYTKQILRIVGFQIEMERIFSLVRILTNCKRSRLQSKNLNRLIFVDKKWPNDPRIGYNPFLLIETHVNLEELEGAFERDEMMKY